MDTTWYRETLRRAGKTGGDLARAIGRDPAVMSRIANGRQRLTLDQATTIARELDVSLAELLERAGVADPATARALGQGFAEGDVLPFTPRERDQAADVASAMAPRRSGVDVWRVTTSAMCLAGYLVGDFLLVDTNSRDSARPGDVVLAQIYDGATGSAETVLRRYDPPVLVAATTDQGARARVVDGSNVVIMGRVIASWRQAS